MTRAYVQHLIRGAVGGLSAYVKPGGLHRLRPEKVFDEVVCNILSQYDILVEAGETGDRIRRGDLAATHLELGKLLARSIREAYRVCDVSHPEFTVPLVIYSLTLGASGVESVTSDTSRFKKMFDAFLSISKWSDVKMFIDALQSVQRKDMYEHLTATGLNTVALIHTGSSFNDVFKVLSSKWPGFELLDAREFRLLEYLKNMLSIYQKTRDGASAAVILYLQLASRHMPKDLAAIVEEVAKSPKVLDMEDMKKLLKVDAELKKRGVDLKGYTEVVTGISAIGAIEGVRF